MTVPSRLRDAGWHERDLEPERLAHEPQPIDAPVLIVADEERRHAEHAASDGGVRDGEELLLHCVVLHDGWIEPVRARDRRVDVGLATSLPSTQYARKRSLRERRELLFRRGGEEPHDVDSPSRVLLRPVQRNPKCSAERSMSRSLRRWRGGAHFDAGHVVGADGAEDAPEEDRMPAERRRPPRPRSLRSAWTPCRRRGRRCRSRSRASFPFRTTPAREDAERANREQAEELGLVEYAGPRRRCIARRRGSMRGGHATARTRSRRRRGAASADSDAGRGGRERGERAGGGTRGGARRCRWA